MNRLSQVALVLVLLASTALTTRFTLPTALGVNQGSLGPWFTGLLAIFLVVVLTGRNRWFIVMPVLWLVLPFGLVVVLTIVLDRAIDYCARWRYVRR